jgi:two-component sensor histidine kinase
MNGFAERIECSGPTGVAREAEHRAKNILATVLATVRLSQADTSDDLKHLIEGRIDALAKVHTLFVESRWAGAELHRLATQELLAYCGEREARVRIDGPAVMLEPSMAQAAAISLHELATNAAKYGSLSAAGGRVEILCPLQRTEGSACAGLSRVGRPPRRPRTAGSAHALWKI